MTRFSLGGDQDGEGPSSPRLKRRRLVLGTAATIAIGDRHRGGGLQAVEEDESASSESEEEEDESESEEEESERDQEHQRQLRTNFELGSASAAQQTGPFPLSWPTRMCSIAPFAVEFRELENHHVEIWKKNI
ncbi:hypothetical protein ACLB2K_007275 [Fragaria x ananassa]